MLTNINHSPIDFSDIEGNEATKAILSRSRFHSYLFYGENIETLNNLSERLAAAILCREGADGNTPIPCRRCNACKKFFSGNHTDFIPIGSDIKVDEMRAYLEKMNYAPIEGIARVFLIKNAEELSITCQNLLLKSIEEPTDDNYFIFTTVSTDRILPTVRSRCMMLCGDNSDIDSKEDDAVMDFVKAALTNDQKILCKKTIEINKIKDSKERREYFIDFLHKLSVALSFELSKTISADIDKATLISEIKKETDKILIKSEQIYLNINLWITDLVFQIQSIHDRYKRK